MTYEPFMVSKPNHGPGLMEPSLSTSADAKVDFKRRLLQRSVLCFPFRWRPPWRDLGDVCHASFLEHEQVLGIDVAAFRPVVRYLADFGRSCSGNLNTALTSCKQTVIVVPVSSYLSFSDIRSLTSIAFSVGIGISLTMTLSVWQVSQFHVSVFVSSSRTKRPHTPTYKLRKATQRPFMNPSDNSRTFGNPSPLFLRTKFYASCSM
jgi:hypothetical protein